MLFVFIISTLKNRPLKEKIVVPWGLVGQQADASQSFGSGLTYTYRCFLLKYFGVSTVDDDPDNWRSKQREAVVVEARITSERHVINIIRILLSIFTFFSRRYPSLFLLKSLFNICILEFFVFSLQKRKEIIPE